ncbi:MAG: hypothetical protein ACUVX8_11425 [Candidatus Zipacnadales bacterium]
MKTLQTASVCVCLGGLVGLSVAAQEHQPQKISLALTDSSVAEAAAAIGEAGGAQVLVMPHVSGQVTLELKEVTVEDALTALTEATQGSWLRTYIIEPVPAKPTEATAEEIVQQLQAAWVNWLQRRTEAELDRFRERAFTAHGGQPPPGPMPTADGGALVDVVQMLRGPFRIEKITLQLQDVTVQEALDRFTLESGEITLLAPEVEGPVTLNVSEMALADVLDALCQQVNASWRPLYLIGQPKQVSQNEVEQFINQAMRTGAERFWQLPPEQRQEIVQRVSERLQNLPPDVANAIRSSPWAPRILSMALQFVMTMTPEQRREIMPIMQGLGRLMGQ